MHLRNASKRIETLQEGKSPWNPKWFPLESPIDPLRIPMDCYGSFSASSPALWWGQAKRLDQLQTRRDSSTSLQPQAVKGHQLCTDMHRYAQMISDDMMMCDDLWCKCARSECPSNLRRAATMVPASTRVNLVSITSHACGNWNHGKAARGTVNANCKECHTMSHHVTPVKGHRLSQVKGSAKPVPLDG